MTSKRRRGVGTHLALPFPKDCDHDESQIEDSEYSERWDVLTQLESQQQNTTIQDSQETMMLDLSTNDLPDNHTIPNPNPTTAKDISVQTDSGNSNIISPNLSSNDACTQTLLTEDPENLRVANEYFGMFVARELSNVPRIKRRQIMFEIVRLLEMRSF